MQQMSQNIAQTLIRLSHTSNNTQWTGCHEALAMHVQETQAAQQEAQAAAVELCKGCASLSQTIVWHMQLVFMSKAWNLFRLLQGSTAGS